MSKQLNRIMLMGRLVADPDMHFTTGNIPYTKFTLAVTRSGGKEKTELVDFPDCIAWRGTAEFANKHLKKGDRIVVEGRLHTDLFTDGENKTRKSYCVNVDEFYFASAKKDHVLTPEEIQQQAIQAEQEETVMPEELRETELEELIED